MYIQETHNQRAGRWGRFWWPGRVAGGGGVLVETDPSCWSSSEPSDGLLVVQILHGGRQSRVVLAPVRALRTAAVAVDGGRVVFGPHEDVGVGPVHALKGLWRPLWTQEGWVCAVPCDKHGQIWPVSGWKSFTILIMLSNSKAAPGHWGQCWKDWESWVAC